MIMLLLLGELFAASVFFNVVVFAKKFDFVSSANLLKNFKHTHNGKTQDIVEKSRGFSFHKQKLIIINDTYYLRINVLVKMNT